MKRPAGSTGGTTRRRAERPTAYAAALKLLTVRDRSEAELTQKLRRKEFSPDEITATIERVRALGYLDDARFARARAGALLSRGKLGPRAVQARLGAAGVSREAIRDAVRTAMEGQDEVELAKRALGTRKALLRSDDPRERARVVRFLLGRGFSPGVVSKVLGTEVEGDEG